MQQIQQSKSKFNDRHSLGDRHYSIAQAVREHLARHRELQDIITMLGIEELSPRDQRVVKRARRLQNYLTQPFHAISQESGLEGVSVPLEQTLSDCEAFLQGAYDDIPEDRCYMRGSMAAERRRN